MDVKVVCQEEVLHSLACWPWRSGRGGEEAGVRGRLEGLLHDGLGALAVGSGRAKNLRGSLSLRWV